MGQIASVLDPDQGSGLGSLKPEGYVTPSFPSLYPPTLYTTRQQTGYFLYEAETIWHFTLFWTMILFVGPFFLSSIYAAFTIILSLIKRSSDSSSSSAGEYQMQQTPSITLHLSQSIPLQHPTKPPPLWPALLLPLIFSALAAFVAFISGTVVGFALAAVYDAGGFSMSTWVPFLWAFAQVLIVIISSYSTLTSIL